MLKEWFNSFIPKLKRNTLAFVLTFAASIMIAQIFPPVRSWSADQAQRKLCHAAAAGDTRTVRVLLAAGATAKPANVSFNPLHFAARHGRNDVIQLLLDEGADVNARGAWQQTALMETVWGGHQHAAQLLLSRGADLTLDDTHDGTALWQAAIANRLEMVRLLMNHGADKAKDAESVLTHAVEQNDTELVRVLLQGGVDPRDVTATHLVLPLSTVARQHQNSEMLKLLRNAGAR